MKTKKHQPALRISVKTADGLAVKLRLYDAVPFGGPVGLYRVKVDREWMRSEAEKYLFLTPAAALNWRPGPPAWGCPDRRIRGSATTTGSA